MKLKIEIVMDNAAFIPETGTELARILRRLCEDLDGDNHTRPGLTLPLLDINGNRVGTAEVLK